MYYFVAYVKGDMGRNSESFGKCQKNWYNIIEVGKQFYVISKVSWKDVFLKNFYSGVGKMINVSKLGVAVLISIFTLVAIPKEAHSAKVMSKGEYIDLLVQKDLKSSHQNEFIPQNASKMKKDDLYKSVLASMAKKGVKPFSSDDLKSPLTKVEMVDFTYAFLTGDAGGNFIERKYFLKEKGVVDPNDIGMVKSYEGDVTFTRFETKKTFGINGSEAVLFKDVAETEEESRLQLVFDDNSELTLGEDSAVEINQMIFDPKKNIRDITVKVAFGKLKVKASKLNTADVNFKIETPTAVIGVRGTEFVVDVNDTGKTKITTIEGLVAVKPNLQPFKINGGSKNVQKKVTKINKVVEKATKVKEKAAAEKAEKKEEVAKQSDSAEETATTETTAAETSSAPVEAASAQEEVLLGANTSTDVSEEGNSSGPVDVPPAEMQKIIKETTVINPVIVAGGGAVNASEAKKVVEVAAKVEEEIVTEEEAKAEEEPVAETTETASEETASEEVASTEEEATTEAGTETEEKSVAEETVIEVASLDKGDGGEKAAELEKEKDSDGDGVPDVNDKFPNDPNEVVDSDGDGVGDNSDAFPRNAKEKADSDGDGVGDNSDAFPNDPKESADSDGDGVGDNGDAFPRDATEVADSDGDGVGDNSDAFPANVNESKDSDGDGIGDNSDKFPKDSTEWVDSDGDGVGDNKDAFPTNKKESKDSDGDGIGDNSDAFPNDATETADSDGDGVGDNKDAFPNNAKEKADSDGDGVGDNSDKFPKDPTEWADSDGDGVGDNKDAFPNNAKESKDSDGDGIGDNSDKFPNDATETADADGDGVGDNKDAFPKNKAEWADSDGDGVGDNSDKFPNDSTETADSDGDGIGNNKDAFPNDATETADSDGDGVGDNKDAFPNDPTETADSDGDGVGDNKDAFPNDPTETADSDGDGVGDNKDAFPNDPTETADSDGDGVGDNKDAFPNDATETADADGDGVGDNKDAFPNDPTETADSDGDGVGDNKDAFPNDPTETVDSDGDGVGDNKDAFPNDPTETADSDGDGVGDNKDAFPNDPTETADSDGDGVGNNKDAFPNDPTETADSDGDGVGNNKDAFPNDPTETADSDGDGVGDNKDAFPFDPTEWADANGNGIGDNKEASLLALSGANFLAMWNTLSPQEQALLSNLLALDQKVSIAQSDIGNLQGTNLVTYWKSLGADVQGQLIAGLTAQQAQTMLSGMAGAELVAFWNALTPSQQVGVVLDGTQALAIMNTGNLSGAVLVNFWFTLDPATQAAIIPSLNTMQAQTILDSLTGAERQAFWNALSPEMQAQLNNGQNPPTDAEIGDAVAAELSKLPGGANDQRAIVASDDVVAAIKAGGLASAEDIDGGFKPENYQLQTGEYTSEDVKTALSGSGYLSYAVQVEEDFVNKASLRIFNDSRATMDGEDDDHRDHVRNELWGNIDSALENSDIRGRDALLEEVADARAGRVLKDANGNWVRVQQYVIRPTSDSLQVVSVNLRGAEAGDLSGLQSMDWQTEFDKNLPGGSAILDLPWADYLNTYRDSSGKTGGDSNEHGKQGESKTGYVKHDSDYELDKMSVEFKSGSDSLKESRSFKELDHGKQSIFDETLTVNGESFEYDRNLNSKSKYMITMVSGGELKYRYSIKDSNGEKKDIDVSLFVVGDAHLADNVGVDGSVETGVKDVWQGLGANTEGSSVNVGNNNLEFRFSNTKASSGLLTNPLDLVYIPLPRMDWKAASVERHHD